MDCISYCIWYRVYYGCGSSSTSLVILLLGFYLGYSSCDMLFNALITYYFIIYLYLLFANYYSYIIYYCYCYCYWRYRLYIVCISLTIHILLYTFLLDDTDDDYDDYDDVIVMTANYLFMLS